MREVEFSVMSVDTPNADRLREALTEFEAQTRIHLKLRVIPWDEAWAELVKVAIYGDGPDISEVGSTWMPDLVGMNGLRQLAPAEVQKLGGQADFFPASWQSATLGDPSTIWAVPWLVDTRILYYRHDLLEQAGIDAREAFKTPTSLAQTLSRLRAAGNAVPWVVPSQETRMTLHNSASFVWGAGGSFVSADGQRILLDQPQARAGFREYFGLARCPIRRVLLGKAGGRHPERPLDVESVRWIAGQGVPDPAARHSLRGRVTPGHLETHPAAGRGVGVGPLPVQR
jgi:ABC-type glycerol-3-phosphate transport system substrate-binding protein